MERNWGGRHDLTDVTTELGADIARRWGEVTDELLLEEALGVELPTVALVEEEESGNGTNHTPANLTTVDCDNKTKSKGKKTIKVELTAEQAAAKKEKTMKAALKAMNLSKSNLTNSTGNVSNKTANISAWADNLIADHTQDCNGPNASNISNCTGFNGTNSSYNATHATAKAQQAAKEKSQKALAKSIFKPPCNNSNASTSNASNASEDTTAGGTGTDATDTTEMPDTMQKAMIDAGAGGDSFWSLDDEDISLVDLHA